MNDLLHNDEVTILGHGVADDEIEAAVDIAVPVGKKDDGFDLAESEALADNESNFLVSVDPNVDFDIDFESDDRVESDSDPNTDVVSLVLAPSSSHPHTWNVAQA